MCVSVALSLILYIYILINLRGYSNSDLVVKISCISSLIILILECWAIYQQDKRLFTPTIMILAAFYLFQNGQLLLLALGIEFNDFYINLWDNSFGIVSNRKTVNNVGISVLNSGIEYISIKNLNQFGVKGNMVGKLRVSSVFNNQQLSYQECSFLACNNLTTIDLGNIEQLNGTFARAVTITTDPSNGRIVLTNNTGVTVNVYWIIDIINNT